MKFLSLPFTPTGSKRLNELIGVLGSLCALLLMLALVSYSPLDPSLNTAAHLPTPRAAQNWIGVVGSTAADFLLQLLGVTAFLLPIYVFFLSVRWFRSRKVEAALVKTAGSASLVVFGGSLLSLLPWAMRYRSAIPAEGVLGRIVADVMVRYLNVAGAYIVSVAGIAVGLFFATAFSFGALQLWLKTRFAPLGVIRERYLDWRERRARKREQRALERKRLQKQKEEERARAQAAAAAKQRTVIATGSRPASAGAAPVRSPEDVYPQRVKSGIERMAEQPAAAPAALSPPPKAEPQPAVGTRQDETRRARTTTARAQGGYKLPPSSLLHRPDARTEFDEEELKELAQTLTRKCAEFEVHGTVTQINPGPVVTTFEFMPEAGIKYSRIVSLQDDLCLALRAESILIERMPGKNTVGIQVPNEKRETIWIRESIESEDFIGSRSKLTFALGKDINGRIVTAELPSMPHLLIAGSTGSGKSVAIHAFMMSMLYKATPDDVRLILVDPKRVELTAYDGIPHLYTPIISEPKLASYALRNAVREMERRLKLLALRGVRNIEQYNQLFAQGSTPSLFEEGGEDEKPLPYIVIIVDELADMMMVDGANVEESITRLAQMARAIGIHLVLATQRPSVDVITGLIKANFPARMSFRVATKIDSRTILDANGAEHLLGKGDMLYLPSGSARVHRLHAPYVAEKEIAATVEFWKKQSTAEYEEGFLAPPPGESSSRSDNGGVEDEGDNDPMYGDAVRLVLEFGKASTSLIQRRLRVGYGRAAHLIDLMERDGIVGPADGPKPREILKRPDWLDEVDTVDEDDR